MVLPAFFERPGRRSGPAVNSPMGEMRLCGMRGRVFAQNGLMTTISTANGEYRILLAPGGTLVPHAAERFAEAAEKGYDCVYADHTVRFASGERKRVEKPDWSPDTLLSANYIESPLAVRSDLLPRGDEDAFDTPEGRYAATLLVTERAQSVGHIRESLYECGAKPLCESMAPLTRALSRRRLRAEVTKGMLPGSFAVRYTVAPDIRLSCIVYGGGPVRSTRATLESVAAKCCLLHIELLVADNGPVEEAKERYYAALEQNRAAKVVRTPQSIGMAQTINSAVRRAYGDVLLLLPAGATLDAPDAAERMLELACQRHVGAVGGVDAEKEEGRGIIHDVRAFDRVLMTRKDVFYASGCLDETFAEAGFIRAYTLLQPGRRLYNVVTPYARFRGTFNGVPDKLSERNKLRIQDMRSFEQD